MLKVPPIDQKRMVTFINHFTINTVNFLNDFMTTVESRFVELESKMRTIESSLMIVEAKVSARDGYILLPFEKVL